MLEIPFIEDALSHLLRPHALDDTVDRLNYFASPAILAFFSLVVTAKQFAGNPVNCWVSSEFADSWEQYVEDYCFVQNTYFVPWAEEIPVDSEERKQASITYYQWVPIVLVLQAVAFLLPNWMWKTLSKATGVSVASAVADAHALRRSPSIERREEVKRVAEYLTETIELKRMKTDGQSCIGFTSSFTMLYIATKISYLVNLSVQLLLLNKYIGAGNCFWGFEVVISLLAGHETLESPLFPRVTLCDVPIRILANNVKHTVQCVLSVNMLNEKIFLIVWFWCLLLIFLTAINLAHSVYQLVFQCTRETACRRWLKGNSSLSQSPSKHAITRFARTDVALMLRFIEGRAGAMVTREIAATIFEKYEKSQNKEVDTMCTSFIDKQ